MKITIKKYEHEDDYEKFKEKIRGQSEIKYFGKTWRVISLTSGGYYYDTYLKVELEEIAEKTKTSKLTVNISIDKTIHELFKEVLENINNEYGLQVTDIRSSWYKTMDGKAKLIDIEVTTRS